MNATAADIQDDILGDMLPDFLDESSQLLESLNEHLLLLDERGNSQGADQAASPDLESLNEMFRAAHSLKGLSAMLGLNNITNLTHKVENIFDAARKDELLIESNVVEQLFQAVDRLEAMVSLLQDPSQDEVDCESVLVAIEQLLQQAGVERKATSQDDAERALVGLSEQENASEQQVIAPSESELRPQAVLEVSEELPKDTSRSSSDSDTSARSVRPQNSSTSNESSDKPRETLRVDVERLDQLGNLVGQLIINKARLNQISDGMNRFPASKQASQLLDRMSDTLARLAPETGADGGSRSRSSESAALDGSLRLLRNDLQTVQCVVRQFATIDSSTGDLCDAVDQLHTISHGIQQHLMRTRMVPIGTLFARFKRVVRDIARGSGKDIRLEVQGEQTEMDKRLIDELGDPLIHMVRNSADHGIESAEVREAAGKPATGTVTLKAVHRGNSIIVSVSDDGKGLDSEKILAKAIEKGIVSDAAASKLSSKDIYDLIWQPGFSTAQQVTDVSGRGMGMDIVRSKIESLNGIVELESTLGLGSTFTITLPLTLAIVPSLMVEASGEVLAVPVESVKEIVGYDTSSMNTVHGSNTTCVRGRTISVIDLSDLYAWNSLCQDVNNPPSKSTTLLILEWKGQELALRVDRLIGQEEVVIKSLAENFRNVQGIAGATILGDGRVSLILDVCVLFEMASHRVASVK